MRPVVPFAPGKRVKPMEETRSRFYLRLRVTNQPGVFAQITRVLGDAEISLASVIQKEEHQAGTIAEVVLTTYVAQEAAMRSALKALASLDAVDEICNVIRIED